MARGFMPQLLVTAWMRSSRLYSVPNLALRRGPGTTCPRRIALQYAHCGF